MWIGTAIPVFRLEIAADTDPTLLENIKTVFDIIGSGVTTIAVVVGALWAYFKFVKGRTFRPRLEPKVTGQWVAVDDRPLLRVSCAVHNIGASVVYLVQVGTGLRISVPAAEQPAPPSSLSWQSMGVFEVLLEHSWVEPGEVVTESCLIDLGIPQPSATQIELRLVVKKNHRHNIELWCRELLEAKSPESGIESPSNEEGQHGNAAPRGSGRNQEVGRGQA